MKSLVIKKKEGIFRFNLGDIIMIVRDGRKLFLHTKDEITDWNEKIDNVVPQLSEEFFGCLKGCYINFNHVKAIKQGKIVFDNGETFPLGKNNYSRTKKGFQEAIEKGILDSD